VRKAIVIGIAMALIAMTFAVVPMNVGAAYTGDITIKSTGDVDPADAPIKKIGNKYILTDDINGQIVVERSGISLIGDGHTLTGSWVSGYNGVFLNAVSDVTVKGLTIDGFFAGMRLESSTNCEIKDNTITGSYMAGIALWYSSNNNIVKDNTVYDNGYGIVLIYYNDYNDISGNYLTGNGNYAIDTLYSDHNTIKNNDVIESGWAGITIRYSEFNVLKDNDVKGHSSYGIRSYYSNDCIFENNRIIENYLGLYLYRNHYNTASENVLIDNYYGLALYNCNYGTATDNVIKGCNDGVDLWYCEQWTFRDNIMKKNEYNFDVGGFLHDYYIHDIDDSNKINGKPIIFWVDEHSKTVPKNAGYVGLVDCSEITVADVSIENSDEGLLLVYTDDSTIQNVNLKNNFAGYMLISSSGNTFSQCSSTLNDWYGVWARNSGENTITACDFSDSEYGVWLESSSGNYLYYNNFIGNTFHAYDDGINTWDDGSGMGNYYDDYTGDDLNNDGVGDTMLPHYYDSYPLMTPY
jgi:parallel beta-helix repeat protein